MILRIILYLAAAASFCYSYIIFGVHSGSNFYIFWDLLGLALVALALMQRFRVFSKLPKAVNIALAGICGAGVLTAVVLLILILSAFNNTGRSDLDYILVLGAQLRDDGPSTVLKFRLDTAAEYLKENPGTLCICSGGQGDNEPCSEALGMAEYLMARGIEEDRLILEDRSKNTRENVKNSGDLIPEGKSIGLVTNNFHMYRALYLTRRYGLKDVEAICADSLPLYLPNNVVREMAGMLKDLIIRKGYTD